MTSINGISIPPQLARGLEDLKGIEGFEGLGELSSPQQAGPSFKEFMLDALDHVNSMQSDADHAVLLDRLDHAFAGQALRGTLRRCRDRKAGRRDGGKGQSE